MRAESDEHTLSDTVTVTADGRTIVDIPRLLRKKHIQDLMRRMEAKTVRVARPAPSATDSE